MYVCNAIANVLSGFNPTVNITPISVIFKYRYAPTHWDGFSSNGNMDYIDEE